MVGPGADLLVGGKGDAHLAVGLAGGHQLLHRGEDQGDARLVVRPQQGGAVGDDQVLAPVVGEGGELVLPHDDVLLLMQDDVAPLIQYRTGLDARTGAVGGGVHVGDQPQHRGVGLTVGGQDGIDVAVGVCAHTGQSHLLHLPGQIIAQLQLAGGRGTGPRVLVRLGSEGDIVQKALSHSHKNTSSMDEIPLFANSIPGNAAFVKAPHTGRPPRPDWPDRRPPPTAAPAAAHCPPARTASRRTGG